MQVREVVVLIFLGFNTYSDVKTSRIILWSAAVFGAVGIVYGILAKDCSLAEASISLLPGVLLLGISKITREALGYGDGIVVLVLGLYIGIRELTWILLSAMILAAVWAGIIMFVRRKKGDHEIPFLPFLLISYLGGLWI